MTPCPRQATTLSRHARYGELRQYRGFLHCLRAIMFREGLAALYQGITPGVLKAGTAAGLGFGVYELCLRHLR